MKTISISTNTPFWNDLCDIVRLFFGETELLRDGGDFWIRHFSHSWGEETAIGRGEETLDVEKIERENDNESGLEAVRLHKRAAKMATYGLLKRYTGQRQVWGALTGIRPSRLFAEGLARFGDEETSMRWLEGEFDLSREKALQLRDLLREQSTVPPPQADQYDVYVGIPFCATRCSYCAFAAVDLRAGAKWVDDYFPALFREIRRSAALVRERNLKPRAVYVGGGTPTAVSAARLDETLGILREEFAEAVEWTVEAGRPDSIDLEKLSVLRKHNVERISVNPQTMNEETLRAIGRSHSPDDVLAAYKMARDAGFSIINMDLIAALPGEGIEELTRSVREIIALKPENITLHSLALKRASRLRIEGAPTSIPAEAAQQAFGAARLLLEDAGYRAYYLYRQKYMAGNLENIGLTLPGKACLYNIDHMEEIAPILACGAGAITKWLFQRERRIERASNVRDLPSYVSRVDEMVERKAELLRSLLI